jgi:hypothetical protein
MDEPEFPDLEQTEEQALLAWAQDQEASEVEEWDLEDEPS